MRLFGITLTFLASLKQPAKKVACHLHKLPCHVNGAQMQAIVSLEITQLGANHETVI